MDSKFIEFLYKKRVFLGFLFGLFYLIFAKPSSGFFLIVGLIIASIGEIIRLIASGFIIKTDELATYGPYAYVRHPLYLGSLVMGFGLCVAVFSLENFGFGTSLTLVYLALFLSVYIPVLKKEESVLIEKYNGEYLDYKAKVNMLFPNFRKYASSKTKAFDKKVFMKNKEYRALFGLFSIFAILILKFIFL